jgi:hypothetical protein
MQVRIGQLPQQFVHSKVGRRARTPQALRCLAQLLQAANASSLRKFETGSSTVRAWSWPSPSFMRT